LVEIYTRYIYEKKWQKTSEKEALRMIAEEMPETDAESTLKYILSQIEKGKTVTLGECRFKASI
jgi:two-component SAPR family response regulator